MQQYFDKKILYFELITDTKQLGVGQKITTNICLPSSCYPPPPADSCGAVSGPQSLSYHHSVHTLSRYLWSSGSKLL